MSLGPCVAFLCVPALQYLCLFLSAGQPGQLKKVQASVTAARKVFRIMRVSQHRQGCSSRWISGSGRRRAHVAFRQHVCNGAGIMHSLCIVKVKHFTSLGVRPAVAGAGLTGRPLKRPLESLPPLLACMQYLTLSRCAVCCPLPLPPPTPHPNSPWSR